MCDIDPTNDPTRVVDATPFPDPSLYFKVFDSEADEPDAKYRQDVLKLYERWEQKHGRKARARLGAQGHVGARRSAAQRGAAPRAAQRQALPVRRLRTHRPDRRVHPSAHATRAVAGGGPQHGGHGLAVQ
jgi:hypothetical protein